MASCFRMSSQGKSLHRSNRLGKGTVEKDKYSSYLQVAQERRCRASATTEFGMSVEN